jgi:hypothetical protein
LSTIISINLIKFFKKFLIIYLLQDVKILSEKINFYFKNDKEEIFQYFFKKIQINIYKWTFENDIIENTLNFFKILLINNFVINDDNENFILLKNKFLINMIDDFLKNENNMEQSTEKKLKYYETLLISFNLNLNKNNEKYFESNLFNFLNNLNNDLNKIIFNQNFKYNFKDINVNTN